MVIAEGDLVLVCEYGDDPHWFEVHKVVDESLIICTNGFRELFNVNRCDVYGVTQDDSVLK